MKAIMTVITILVLLWILYGAVFTYRQMQEVQDMNESGRRLQVAFTTLDL